MRKKHQPPQWMEVEIERDGVIHKGSYYVQQGSITVSYGGRSESTQVGEMPADTLARVLLSELFTKSIGNR